MVTDYREKKPAKPPAKKKGGARTPVLAGILAIVALVALWLSDCVPGFGGGSEGGGDDKTAKSEKAEKAEKTEAVPEVQTEAPDAVRKPMPLKVTVDGRGCSINGTAYSDCNEICEANASLLVGADSAVIDAKDGSHEKVTAIVDCLKANNISSRIDRD